MTRIFNLLYRSRLTTCLPRVEAGFLPIGNMESFAYLAFNEIEASQRHKCNCELKHGGTRMKNRMMITWMTMSALALSFLLVGCDREISSNKTSTVSSDGTVKEKEKTVTES